MAYEKKWFKAKRYGWGWYPVSWEGWAIIALYLLVIIPIFLAIDARAHSSSDTLINFSLPFIGLTSFLLSICYIKGEWPRWRWGEDEFEKTARRILKEIKKAKNILLHCHPSPDPDSVGSVLAMKFALESMGKKVTAIQGDSEIPQAFMHFPGAQAILKKNFFEIDIKEFDLFIVLDSSHKGVSRLKDPILPYSLKVINIDHHRTNPGFGNIRLIDSSYPANCLILFNLFKVWNIALNPDIATNLFIGIYTDTGGFKYEGVNAETFKTAGELVEYIADLPGLISKMENSTTQGFLRFEAEALQSISVHLNGILAISSVSFSTIENRKLADEDVQASRISSFIRTVPDWKIVACGVEFTKGESKFSFRSSDSQKYDVSRLAMELGGGGHKAASGALLKMSLDEAVKKVVETAKLIYNL